jgi:hypothetical protein
VALSLQERQARYQATEKCKITRARWKAENAEKIKQKNAEYRARVGVHPMNDPRTASYRKYRLSDKFRRTSLNSHLKRKYGITLEEYMKLFEEQGGVCKICSGTDMRRWRDGRIQRVTLFVDHEHSTGRIRGLLCNKCNVGVAMFGDDEEMMLRAAKYLKEN